MSSESDVLECDFAVIGAGVIGLAIAARLAEKGSTFVLESFPKFGQETSSRNSEVVHSGIYYPVDSRKTRWCIEGREALYRFCEANDVDVSRLGKLVVATSESEQAYLEKLSAHSQAVEVPHRRLTRDEITSREPHIQAMDALFFPESGIVNSHEVMAVLERKTEQAGGQIVYRHQVRSLERGTSGYRLRVNGLGEESQIQAGMVVNAAGLGAGEISNLALGTDRYRHKFCRGRYFSLAGSYRGKFRHLVYPVPPKDGLGIHITLDMQGNCRLGPDVEWSDLENYSDTPSLYDCDWEALRPAFVTAVHRYCPLIDPEALSPGLIGIRPKLFIDGKAHPDFLVERHQDFIHCLGIESPGLTSSLAIAEAVVRLVG